MVSQIDLPKKKCLTAINLQRSSSSHSNSSTPPSTASPASTSCRTFPPHFRSRTRSPSPVSQMLRNHPHGPVPPLPQLSRYRSHESLTRGQLCGYETANFDHNNPSNNAPAPAATTSSRTSSSVTSQTSNHGAHWLGANGRANSWSSGLGREREFEFSRQNPRRERRQGHRDHSSSSSSSSSKHGTNSNYQMQNPAALGFLLGTALVFNRTRQEKEKEEKPKKEEKKEEIIRKDDDVLKIICQGITLEPEKGKKGEGEGHVERKVDEELKVKEVESKVPEKDDKIAQKKREEENGENPRVQSNSKIAAKEGSEKEGLPEGENGGDPLKAEKPADENPEGQEHKETTKDEDHNIPFQITSMDFAHSGSNSVRWQQKFLHPLLAHFLRWALL